MKDMRGIEIKVGDRVVYGKSNRNNPINMGVIKRIEGKSLYILGDGSTREGNVGYSSRILVLPEGY